ncbi:hypothetical protein [Pantoea agglomerans]|uniref:hypothetical protein n=1 Tax=Enterobacter agglomerans TaxID=549 RepID=UPI003C798066
MSHNARIADIRFHMPIIIFLIIGLFSFMYWDSIISNIEVLGALATALAFLATAWAAFEARSSAKAAFRAVELTRESLIESKKASFKQWYYLLLEKNLEMQKGVEAHLNSNKELNDKLKPNLILARIHSSITSDSILSSFIRHVCHILNYIDNEYYGGEHDLIGKKIFTDQLSNVLTDRLKLIIAIYGLNYGNFDHVDNANLRGLLQKFDFFKNDIFFDDAISERQYLDIHVSKRFYKDYRESVSSAIDYQLKRSIYDSMPEHFVNSRVQPSLFYSVLYAYDTPAKKYIEKAFSEFSKHTRAEILIKIENAPKAHRISLNELRRLKGYYLSFKRRSRYELSRRLSTLAMIINALRHLILKAHKNNPKGISLSDFCFHNIQVRNDIKEGINSLRIVENYALSLSLLKLRVDADRHEKISSLVTSAEKEIFKVCDCIKAFSL